MHKHHTQTYKWIQTDAGEELHDVKVESKTQFSSIVFQKYLSAAMMIFTFQHRGRGMKWYGVLQKYHLKNTN